MHRAHEDDRAAALLADHVPQAGARGQESAIKEDPQHPLLVGKGHIGDAVDVLHARVAHENIDAA